jgi:tetraacyldisaccharide 4'-kinase
MLDGTSFRDFVSGRRRGLGAVLARGVLRLAEVPYTWAVRWRNRRYDRGRSRVHRVGVPVVSVGNLTLGGTGKTPLVKWLAHWFAQRNVDVAIVSRGYGTSAGQRNDEALELAQALPSVPHVQDPDRVAAARRAIDEFACQLIVLDDGFQHRRLARDLDIVLLDATEPFGFEHVFPRGTLREPLAGLARARIVCLSRADLLDPAGRERIRQRVVKLAPRAVWCEAAHAPRELVSAAGHSQPLSALAGRRVAAFCGIGNPGAFRRSLAAAGGDVVCWREFPDHHAYRGDDRAELARAVAASAADLVVCTEKDLVKLPVDELGQRPLWALAIEMTILSGGDGLEDVLQRVLPLSRSND